MLTIIKRTQIKPIISTFEEHIELIIGKLSEDEDLKYQIFIHTVGWRTKRISPRSTLLCIAKRGSDKVIILQTFRGTNPAMEVWDDHIAAIKGEKLKIQIAL